jgi:arginine/lysine/ornithine decarboxylase
LLPSPDICGEAVEVAPQKGKTGKRFEFVKIEEAAGRTAYSEIGIYPPGIPLVAGGELISEELCRVLLNTDKENLFGVVNDRICVII